MKTFFLFFSFLLASFSTIAQESLIDQSFGINGRLNLTFLNGNLSNSGKEILRESSGNLFLCGNLNNAIDLSKIMGGMAVLKFNGKLDSTSLFNGKIAFDLNIRPVENVSPFRILLNSKGAIFMTLLQGKTPFSNQLKLGSLARSYNFNPNFNGGQLVNVFSQSEKDSLIIFNHRFKVQSNNQMLISYRKQSIPKVAAANIITRYNEDGSLDKSFGIQGRIVIDSNGLNKQLSSSGVINNYDIFETSQNKILLIGDTVVVAATSNKSFIKLIRYNANGSLDPTFGANGVIRLSTLDISFRAATQDKNNNLYIAGILPPNVILLKVKSNGVIDSSFGNKGISTLNKNLSISHLVLNSQQDPIVAGVMVLPNNSTQLQVYYLKANGSPQNIGVNGGVSIPLKSAGAFLSDILPLPDGSVILLARSLLNSAGTQTEIEISKIKSFNTIPIKAESSLQENIQIYPNPATDVIYLKENTIEVQARIFNALGRFIFEKRVRGDQSIPIHALTPGLYFIKLVKGNKEIGNSRFVKSEH